MSTTDKHPSSDRDPDPSSVDAGERDSFTPTAPGSPVHLPKEERLLDLADLFKVFSDTTRIKILFTLLEGSRCVADIAAATTSSQSAVSHQLRVLKQAHLVCFRRCGRSIEYSLADDHVYTMLQQGMNHICE